MGKLGGFLQIERHGIAYRDPRERAHDYQEFVAGAPRARSCATRARAAWNAACRSATTAVRWAT